MIKTQYISRGQILGIIIFLLLLGSISYLIVIDYTKREPQLSLYQQTRTNLLGTAVTVNFYDQYDQSIYDAIFQIVKDIDQRLSFHDLSSEISRINMSSSISITDISQETLNILEQALLWADHSEGAFDPTIGTVMELWKDNSHFSVLPEASNIENSVYFVDYKLVKFESNKIRLPIDTKLDLGAIAKGYAADMAVSYIKKQQIPSAVLDFGGNIYAIGSRPDGLLWQIGVRSPLKGEDASVCVVSVEDISIVTSGLYERYFEKNDSFYHHILDPRTGYPAQTNLLSVTVISKSSTQADALSTACFVMGLPKGLSFIESSPNCEAIFITEDLEIFSTSGIYEKIKLIDPRFTLINNTN